MPTQLHNFGAYYTYSFILFTTYYFHPNCSFMYSQYDVYCTVTKVKMWFFFCSFLNLTRIINVFYSKNEYFSCVKEILVVWKLATCNIFKGTFSTNILLTLESFEPDKIKNVESKYKSLE